MSLLWVMVIAIPALCVSELLRHARIHAAARRYTSTDLTTTLTASEGEPHDHPHIRDGRQC